MTNQLQPALAGSAKSQHIDALRAVLFDIVTGTSEEDPRVLAYRALRMSASADDLPAPRGVPVYQGHRGVVVKGGSRWEDLTKAQFDEWNVKGFETRVLFADPIGMPPAVDVHNIPTSDELRIDWCVRMLTRIKDGGRASLGDAYPEIVQVWGALRRVQEAGLDSGPADGVISATAPAPKTSTSSDGPCRLTERKTNEIMASRSFRKVGYVLADEDGEICLSAQSAVRWLPQAHYWRLMHAQDGMLFYQPPTDQPSRQAFEAWDDAGPLRGGRRVWQGTSYAQPAIQSDWRAWSAGIAYYIAVQAAARAAVELGTSVASAAGQ